MKRHALTLAISLACCTALPVMAGSLDPELQEAVAAASVQEDVPVIIRFADTVDLVALRREARQLAREAHPGDSRAERKARRKLKRRMLVDALKGTARQSSREVNRLLRSHGESPSLKLLWARNSVAGSLPADLLDAVAALPGVARVSLDITLQGPGDGTVPSAPSYWNLPATGVQMVWDTGNTGQDVVVATLDTGVDAAHPDLGSRWRGGPNSWFDPHGQNAAPVDGNGHGTQVMGLMVGGDALGYQIGMAPGAQWIAAKIYDNANQATLSAIHEAYQWILDPDDDPATDDAPDIVNNSWALQGTVNVCNQEFAADIALLKEAEIAVLFSAGNYGPNADTSVSPANDPAVVAVGSVDSALNIDIQSSRGAGACDGGIYPHLVAPGDGVLTADRVPLYYNVVSGTSFAVAHLAGAMAVLKSAFPDATVGELESSLLETAVDLGPGGPDDDFGYGMLDVTAAYDWLAANLGAGTPQPGTLAFGSATYSVDENVATLSVTVTRTGGTAGQVSVDYDAGDGTATAGQDYQAGAGTLVFADGETSRSIGVALIDDTEYEGNETFSLSLSNAQGGATLGGQQDSIVTILDDDPVPQPGTLSLGAGSYSVAEDSASVMLTLLRTGGSDGAVSVTVATSDGSASAGADYGSVAGTVTLQDGQTNVGISIPILDDADVEGDESFGFALSNPGGGATLGATKAVTVTILDNDQPTGPVDSDGDGFSVDLDCNDNNASVYPGAAEVKHDGVDQDCNGYDLTIDVTRAWYVSRQNKIVVWATSDRGAAAGLRMNATLSNGDTIDKPLSWNASKRLWQKTIKNLAASALSVTISGAEGEESSVVQQR